ncbi:ARM repeat superfamily protein [Striga asiatica]|uniref:ARM repeat superfamily protein n=1 Tax=Striga asiatica TaxID=4170 RepID=A0A5A7PQL2_STRAF|nr:ARM repeat superfamily protein [Striga asiatica]
MSNSSSSILQILLQLSEPLHKALLDTPYTSPEADANVSIKSHLQSLLPGPAISEVDFRTKIKDFVLCCAALASASNSSSQHLSWVPHSLSASALSALKMFAEAYCADMQFKCSMKVGELDFDLCSVVESNKKLVMELLPEVLPLLKDKIKESAIDASNEDDGVSAASARVPVAWAILSAYQLRWFVVQVDVSFMGKICPLVIPCALTALDHWSPEVKGQGMLSFIYLAKHVDAADIGGYADVILDACCQNIASDDEIWHYVVEMSVLLVTLTQQTNPRSTWYEKLLNEMLNHLERQPRNKKRRIAWLTYCEPLFNCLGLVLLAHFRRLFPLFFKWMHADDDETVLLVLERMITVLRLTWIRNSQFMERLVDELVTLYKDAALKVAREDIRSLILQMLKLIRVSKGQQLDAAWLKYKDDPTYLLLPSS